MMSKTNVGSQTSNARNSTRCSKFNLKLCFRRAAAGGELRSEAILFDPTVEAPAAESKCLCSMAYVASMARERLADQERFYFFQAHLFDGPGPIAALQR